METTRLSSKGQIVLPKSVREARSWKPGTEFAVDETSEGILLRPLRPFPPTNISDVFGCLKYKGRAKTLRQMDMAIAKGVRARHDRGRY
ncbi:MAG: AbrB/MazE/SpoVT family DNA-binding domain-containing protein [Terriglobia bacterium]|jgi:AbrB family looped-hinge helix DNA binding protein